MKCLTSVVRLVALALYLAAGQASANITYSFSGATFSDGGMLTGTFTTNNAINSLVSANITTSPGAGGFGFTYTLGTATSFSSLPTILVFNSLPSADNILQVTFNPSLTAIGAPIRIGTFDSFEQRLALPHRTITAGAAVIAGAIPEPESYALMLAGLSLLGLAARRRKQKAA